MARIKKDTAKEREKYMLDLFKKQPDLSIQKANDKLKTDTGQMMRAQRAYEIRASARKQLEAEKGGQPSVQAAGRRGVKPKKRVSRAARVGGMNAVAAVTEGRNRLVIIETNKDNMEFFQSAIEAINKAGVANLKIDHSTNSYAIITG